MMTQPYIIGIQKCTDSLNSHTHRFFVIVILALVNITDLYYTQAQNCSKQKCYQKATRFTMINHDVLEVDGDVDKRSRRALSALSM